jgi:hypothetical protein
VRDMSEPIVVQACDEVLCDWSPLGEEPAPCILVFGLEIAGQPKQLAIDLGRYNLYHCVRSSGLLYRRRLPTAGDEQQRRGRSRPWRSAVSGARSPRESLRPTRCSRWWRRTRRHGSLPARSTSLMGRRSSTYRRGHGRGGRGEYPRGGCLYAGIDEREASLGDGGFPDRAVGILVPDSLGDGWKSSRSPRPSCAASYSGRPVSKSAARWRRRATEIRGGERRKSSIGNGHMLALGLLPSSA